MYSATSDRNAIKNIQDRKSRKIKLWLHDELGLTKRICDHIDDPKTKGVASLIQGKIQSGKTRTMIGIMIGALALCKQASVIVVRNLKVDADQFVAALKKRLKAFECHFNKSDVSVALAGSKSQKNKNLMSQIFSSGKGIIVCMANGSQISNVLDTHKQAANPELFNLFVDEADDLYDKDPLSARVFYTQFQKLKAIANKKYCVTATSFDLFFVDHAIRTSNAW